VAGSGLFIEMLIREIERRGLVVPVSEFALSDTDCSPDEVGNAS
jgi:hypothetical protein